MSTFIVGPLSSRLRSAGRATAQIAMKVELPVATRVVAHAHRADRGQGVVVDVGTKDQAEAAVDQNGDLTRGRGPEPPA